MKKVLFIVAAILLTVCFAHAQFYVSTSGSDSNPGTFEKPFRTIQQAANKMGKGDTCFIREGIYPETIIPQRDGSQSEPLVFTNYNDEMAVVTGTEKVNNWIPHHGDIIKAYVPDSVSQLLTNFIRATQASFPDLERSDPYNTEAWVNIEATSDGHVRLMKARWTKNYWKGAYVRILTKNHWIAHLGKIHSSAGSYLYCDQRSKPWDDYNPDTYLGKGVGYIFGHLNALDASGEWHWQNDTLYYHLRSGENPETLNALARVREFAFVCEGRSNIKIKNINFLCANVSFGQAQFCELVGALVYFPTPFFIYSNGWCRDEGRGADFSIDHWEGKGLYCSGKNNRIKDCYVLNSWGDGISVGGTHNRIENCLIENCNWSATDAACISVTGFGHIIENNTMRRSARSILVNRFAESTNILSNELSDAGLMCEDLGMTYSYNTNGRGSVIAFNWVHDNHARSTASGIYLDNYDSNYVVHHNVIWNCSFAIQTNKPAYNHKIFHNTVWNCEHAQWAWGREGTIISKQEVVNNLSDKLWNVGNVFQANLTVGNDFLKDPGKLDFRPKEGSSAIDGGKVLPGINDHYSGSAPDIGAYESGFPAWKPGSSIKPIDFKSIINLEF